VKTHWTLFVVAGVCLALSSATGAWQAVQLTNNSYGDWGVQHDGVNVVWTTDNREVVLNNGGSSQVIYTDVLNNCYAPQISSGNVVWYTGLGTADTEIYWYNGTSVQRLTDNEYVDRDCFISGTNIVWRGNATPGGPWGIGEIFYFDGATTHRLTNNDRPEGFPDISGNQIVWERTETTGFENIYHYDGSTITQLTNTYYSDDEPKISGAYTTWVDPDGYVMVHDGSTATAVSGYNSDHRQPQIDGNRVAWYTDVPEGFDIFYFDGSTTTQITDNNNDSMYVRISGEKLVWQEYVNGRWQIFLYDGEIHQLTAGPMDSQYPEITGDLVTWMTHDGNDYEVYKMVVPEPATMSLLALGALALLRRRRR